MSECLVAAGPASPAPPSASPARPLGDRRAARLAKFKREQLVVDYLDRGVPAVEIAARIGVGEKRMRAVVRLNEAPLVAFSAMTGANLEAVAQVVKIVREFDRYPLAFAAAGRRFEPNSLPARVLDGLTDDSATDERALAWQADLALPDTGAGASPPLGRVSATGEGNRAGDPPRVRPERCERPYLPRRCGVSHEPRPEEPAERASRRTFQRALERPSRRDACGAAPQDEVGAEGSAYLGSYERPEIP